MENNRSSVKNALLHGDLFTKLSAVLMGIGMIGHKQVIKGCLVFLFEIAFIYYMLSTGIHSLAMMPSLGDRAQEKVWNEAKQIYEYIAGDNSQQILLAGVITCFVIAAIIVLWIIQLKFSYKLELQLKEKGEITIQKSR